MNPSRRFLPAALVAAAAFAASCAPAGDPVRATLDRMAKAARDRDAAALMEHVAADFQAGDGRSRSDAEALVRSYFAGYDRLDVTFRNVEIERAENTARVRLRAAMSGQPSKMAGLSGLLPTSASYDFDLRLSRDGKTWKVAWASWQPAE